MNEFKITNKVVAYIKGFMCSTQIIYNPKSSSRDLAKIALNNMPDGFAIFDFSDLVDCYNNSLLLPESTDVITNNEIVRAAVTGVIDAIPYNILKKWQLSAIYDVVFTCLNSIHLVLRDFSHSSLLDEVSILVEAKKDKMVTKEETKDDSNNSTNLNVEQSLPELNMDLVFNRSKTDMSFINNLSEVNKDET